MFLRKAIAADIPAMHHIRVAVRENALFSPGRITPAEAFYRARGWRDCGLAPSGERRFEWA